MHSDFPRVHVQFRVSSDRRPKRVPYTMRTMMSSRRLSVKIGLVAVAALLWAGSATAQIRITKRFVMAYHACAGTLCTDPANHSVYLGESDDGAVWSGVLGWAPFAGSVPDVIQRGRTLSIHTANAMVWRFSLDTGMADRVTVRVTGLPSGRFGEWVDPSLYVDEEGRLILFMMYAPQGAGDPARCRSGEESCTKQFFSATEVPGSDGTEFALDSGDRATVTIPATGPLAAASDPDVFFDGTQYVMYISHGPSITVWTSATLKGTYTRSTLLTSGLLSNLRGGVPAGHFDTASARYWTYAHMGQSGISVIRRAVHAGLTEALGDTAWATAMTGSLMGLGASISVESPSFTVLTLAAPVAPVHCAILTTPGPLMATVAGDSVAFDWGGVGGASSYVLEAGSSPGLNDLLTVNLDTAGTSATGQHLATGTYYVRIRAANACGTSAPSNDVTVVVR